MSKFNFPHPLVTDPVQQANNDALKMYLDSLESGATPASWAAYSTSSSWVQDPGDDYTFWLVLDATAGHADLGDSGDGWTTVDHRGVGKPTLLVPPSAGAYAYGAHFGYQVRHTGTPTVSLKVDHGPAIVSKSGGGVYSIELHVDRTPLVFASYNTDVSAPIIADALQGFAPKMQNPATNEYGFAVYTLLKPTANFTPDPTDVHTAGWASMLWAHKIG